MTLLKKLGFAVIGISSLVFAGDDFPADKVQKGIDKNENPKKLEQKAKKKDPRKKNEESKKEEKKDAEPDAGGGW